MDSEKQKFLRDFREVYNYPEKYVVKNQDGTLDCSRLQEFFNRFVKVYLHKDMAGITPEFPSLVISKFKSAAAHSKKTKETAGRFSNEPLGITINIEKFEGLSKSALREAIIGMLPIVCHEYQHFKQYVMVKASRGELNLGEEQMKKLKAQFVSKQDPESVLDDCLFGGMKADAIKFVRLMDPQLYAKAKRSDSVLSRLNIQELGGDSVLRSHYFLKANEVDARESSILFYDDFVRDVERYNFTHGDKFVNENGQEQTLEEVPVSRLKRVGAIQRTKNSIDNKRHSHRVMETFCESMKNMKPEKILSYIEMIEKKFPESSAEARSQILNQFAALLEVACHEKGPAEAQEFLTEIMKTAKGPHKVIVEKYIPDLLKKIGIKTVEKVSEDEFVQYRNIDESSKPEYSQTKNKNQRTMSEEEKSKFSQNEEVRMMSRFDD